MSFSLLRVPKKAALTVWSGLVVGTSCTLLLLTEDRRRRINQARSAIKNADRIRSSKQYHATAPILNEQPVAAIDKLEDVLSPTKTVTRRFAARRRDEYKDWSAAPTAAQIAHGQPAPDAADSKPESLAAAEHKRGNDGADLVLGQRGSLHGIESEQAVPQRRALAATRSWGIPPRDSILLTETRTWPGKGRPSPGLSEKASRSSPLESQHIHVDSNLRRIKRAADFGDQMSLEQAVDIIRETVRKTGLEAEERGLLVQAAIMLSLKCQKAGLMDPAMRALHSAVELGPLAEAQYYEANPQQVIDYAVSIAEVKIRDVKEKGMKTSKHERLLLRKRMDRTIMLMTPTLAEGMLSASRLLEWLPAAEKCMHLAFDLGNMMDKASSLFWRIEHFGGDPEGRILLGFMERLHESGKLPQLVNTFKLMRHKLVKLNADTWYAIGDLVADAVDNAPGQNPAKVLEYMVEFCPRENCCEPLLPLRTTWTTKILYCHWKRVGDFEQTHALFQRFEELGGFDIVVHKDGMYRTMVQIALEAEQWHQLDQLLRKLVAVKPSAAKEARILGLLALAKARMGDWNAVWEDFKSMEIKDRIEDVFVPILQEFIKTHTTKEIENFLKSYIRDIKMPISPYLVNMIANRYGDVRDVESFLEWLSWCSIQGFEINAAFSNAILVNCRRRWDFGFEDLSHIYRTLQALSPNFIDDVTENAMVCAGLTAHRKAKIPFLKKQVGFANRKFHRWTVAESADDMRIDMRHAFSMRDYKKVLFLYRTTVHKKNIPLDEGHLRLAVQASLRLEKRMQPVLRMIREAKEQEMDVSQAVTLVFIVQMRQIFQGDTSDKDQLVREVQNCIAHFEASDLSVGHQALLRVAFQMLRARHFSGAISFGMSALQEKGIAYPDDVPTFKLFLVAYGYKADVRGMKWTLAGAVHMQYYRKRAVYLALKDARNFLAKQIQSADVKKARRVVEKGLDMIRQQQLQLAVDRKLLQRQTIDIMKRAALEAEDQPTSEEAIKRREDIFAEIEENIRREQEEESSKAEARRIEMQARREAAEAAQQMNQDEANAMEQILAASRHEVHGDF
ncbi:hypothetical protein N0V93_004187 [Gnomoniopsis smithogilvyi]|uniref:Uncharacterized protein n=1 Tax=Gnomoniopsis smithogilvyi TaxID=1191159 RepID=A0A9W9CWY8_9PEZI|nr:hypothetical protein N0V93_004187 [Gnomoniopsis smithogilvyi]